MFEDILLTELAKEEGEIRFTIWTVRSPRFKEFVSKYKLKLSKKINSIKKENTEDLVDVFFEIEVAYYLTLQDCFEILDYEPSNIKDNESGRCPDFHVRFNGEFDFYLEVKRIRDQEEINDENFRELVDRDIKIKDVIFEKLTQFVKDQPNVLFIFTSNPDFYFHSPYNAIAIINGEIRKRNEMFFQHRTWDGTGIIYFLQQIKNLSATVLRTTFRDQEVIPNNLATCHIPEGLKDALKVLKPIGELSREEYLNEFDKRYPKARSKPLV